MRINKENVIKYMRQNNWSQADLAKVMKVDPSTVSRVLNGTRGTGKDVISGLLNAFPDASIDELFFLDGMSPNNNTKTA